MDHTAHMFSRDLTALWREKWQWGCCFSYKLAVLNVKCRVGSRKEEALLIPVPIHRAVNGEIREIQGCYASSTKNGATMLQLEQTALWIRNPPFQFLVCTSWCEDDSLVRNVYRLDLSILLISHSIWCNIHNNDGSVFAVIDRTLQCAISPLILDFDAWID